MTAISTKSRLTPHLNPPNLKAAANFRSSANGSTFETHKLLSQTRSTHSLVAASKGKRPTHPQGLDPNTFQTKLTYLTRSGAYSAQNFVAQNYLKAEIYAYACYLYSVNNGQTITDYIQGMQNWAQQHRATLYAQHPDLATAEYITQGGNASWVDLPLSKQAYYLYKGWNLDAAWWGGTGQCASIKSALDLLLNHTSPAQALQLSNNTAFQYILSKAQGMLPDCLHALAIFNKNIKLEQLQNAINAQIAAHKAEVNAFNRTYPLPNGNESSSTIITQYDYAYKFSETIQTYIDLWATASYLKGNNQTFNLFNYYLKHPDQGVKEYNKLSHLHPNFFFTNPVAFDRQSDFLHDFISGKGQFSQISDSLRTEFALQFNYAYAVIDYIYTHVSDKEFFALWPTANDQNAVDWMYNLVNPF